MKKKVVMGFLGTQLDSGLGSGRWEKWRPTVSIAQHEDLVVDRLELMHDARNKPLAERVRDDVVQLSPGTEVRLVEMNLANPWDFGEVYGALYDRMRAYPFDTEREEYWAHITTGTHVAQICLFLLVEARFIPGVLLQTAPPRGRQGQGTGSYELIDLDLSRYDAINARLAVAQQDAVSFLKSGIATRNPRFNSMEIAAAITLADRAWAHLEQTRISRRFAKAFEQCDLILAPVTPVTPFPWTELFAGNIDGQAMRNYYHWLGLTYVVTLATNPALALPCGKDEQGMPFGLQVIGRLHGDAQLLAASQALEQVFADNESLRRPVPDLKALQTARPDLKSIVTHPPELAGVQGAGGLTAV